MKKVSGLIVWLFLIPAGLAYALPIALWHLKAGEPRGYYDAEAPCPCGHPNYYLVEETEWFEISVWHNQKKRLGTVKLDGKEAVLSLDRRSDLSLVLRRTDDEWALHSPVAPIDPVQPVKNPWKVWVQKVWRIFSDRSFPTPTQPVHDPS